MMTIDAIRKILPQKFPFLMVDKVVALEAGKRLVAVKNVAINEDFFQGHFAGRPVMPGALIIEAMAQCAILLHSTLEGQDPGHTANYYLGSVKAQFFKPVVPGDQLRVEALLVKAMAKGLFVEAKAYVGEDRIAEADLICMVEK